MSETQDFGEQLRDAAKKELEESDISVLQLANESGVPQPTLFRFLAGQQASLKLSTAEKLARRLGYEFVKAAQQ